MANVIRLNNGGSIQVRTGVLQGIGPIGPRGLIGPQGPEGVQGPQGETGPPGAITQYMTQAKVGSAQNISADTDYLVSFSSVSYDDLSAAQSATNFSPNDPGDYLVSCWAKFDKPTNAGDGSRSLWLTSSINGTLVRTQVDAIADEATYVEFSWPTRAVAGEVLKVYARHSDDVSVTLSEGAIAITRIGSGPRGLTGPQGAQGPVGPAGPQGPQGPDGDANSGFLTYADLRQ